MGQGKGLRRHSPEFQGASGEADAGWRKCERNPGAPWRCLSPSSWRHGTGGGRHPPLPPINCCRLLFWCCLQFNEDHL